MSSSTLAVGLRQLGRQLAVQHRHDDSDEQLLLAFLNDRDDQAFAVLVRRHGPMVMQVCQRVLDHQQDAEDVFQAAFLVLARNADSLRNKASLAGFLHGTAFRLALQARRSAARRRKHEGQQPLRTSLDPVEETSWREVRTCLDEEIARLPEIYRSVFILCCLENRSRAEVGRRLGLKECTVMSRLAGARKRLSQRLSRRGIELTAVLAALSLPLPPARLTASTIQAALATTAGEGLTGMVSPSVAVLVEKSSPILSLSKGKLAVLLVAVSLLGGGALLHFQPAATESEPPTTAAKAKPTASAQPSAKEDDKDTVTYAGRVLDPDGKPLAGARLYLLYATPKDLPIPVRAASDKAGRFRFTVAHKDFDQSVSLRPWDEAILVARAKGYGIGVLELPPDESKLPLDLKLRLTRDDVPITGRVLDLQGRPLAGVSVRLHELYWARKNDLSAWLADLKEKKVGYPTISKHLIGVTGLWMGRDLGKIFPPVSTGADGRFVLRGVGRERVVALRLQQPTMAAADFFAMTRAGDTIRTASWRRDDENEMIFRGSPFEHIAGPPQTIVGVIRDQDTGKPLPGAVVQSYVFASRGSPNKRLNGQTRLKAVADKEGRYRLDGMPRGKGNVIRAAGPANEAYLMVLAAVPEGFALNPVTVDLKLKRGVWIEGTVTDKATGKPVHSIIRYAVDRDNPLAEEVQTLSFEDDLYSHAKDGRFRFAGCPGRGAVSARAWSDRYLTYVGADRIKGLDRLNLLGPYNTVVEVNPVQDAQSVRCNILLDPGRMRTGTVLDPEGRPLTGVTVAGLSATGEWRSEPLTKATFHTYALKPSETRLLQFAHAGKHLAGSLVVKGDARGPLTVKLQSAGTLTGRFVRPDGKAWADEEIFARRYEPMARLGIPKPPDSTIGSFPNGARTDKDGKFRIENLAPGLKYRPALRRGFYELIPDGPAGTGVTVEAGKTKDLGNVTVKPI